MSVHYELREAKPDGSSAVLHLGDRYAMDVSCAVLPRIGELLLAEAAPYRVVDVSHVVHAHQSGVRTCDLIVRVVAAKDKPR